MCQAFVAEPRRGKRARPGLGDPQKRQRVDEIDGDEDEIERLAPDREQHRHDRRRHEMRPEPRRREPSTAQLVEGDEGERGQDGREDRLHEARGIPAEAPS